MLTGSRAHAALPASDLERAKRFYAEKLGLSPTEEKPEGVRYELAGSSALFVFPTAVSGRGGHTQAGFEVADVDAAVADLKSRGVQFEESENDAAAWFKDSEGNLLVVVQV